VFHPYPESVRAPRYYRVDERPNGFWVWMEHVADDYPGPWRLEAYAFAARQLGHWNGTYLAGKPLPGEPWLARRHLRSWLNWINPEQEWQFRLLLKHCSPERRRQYDRMWAERALFCDALEALPQAWAHLDIQRRNMFIGRGEDGQEELALVDWAFSGIGPVWAEAAELVSVSSYLLEWPPADVLELETAVLAEYRRGLAEAGWAVNEAALRLGFSAWAALWQGAIFPNFSIWLCSPESRAFSLEQFGIAEEELFLKQLPIFEYCLDKADEARTLMQ